MAREKTEPDTDWETIARQTEEKLTRACLERDEMRDFLKWMLAHDRISKGLKALIVEALAGRFLRL
jgi:hypothetical protein